MMYSSVRRAPAQPPTPVRSVAADPSVPKEPAKSTLTEEQIAELRARLLEERRKVLAELRAIEDEAVNESADDATSSQGTFSVEVGDTASEVQHLESTLMLRDHTNNLLSQIEDALKAIEDGTYGICRDTGQPIPYERLRVYPTALTLVKQK
jgi:RNA polymerase-binding protein DksA